MKWPVLLVAFLLPGLAQAACNRAGGDVLKLEPLNGQLCMDFTKKDRSLQMFRIDSEAGWISPRMEAIPGKGGTLAFYRVENGERASKSLWRGKLDRTTGKGAGPRMLIPQGDYAMVFEDEESPRLRGYLTLDPVQVQTGPVSDVAALSLPAGEKPIWTLTPEGTGTLWDLTLSTPLGYSPAWLRLDGPEGLSLPLRGGSEGGVTGLADVRLPAGQYSLTVKDHPSVPVVFVANPSRLKKDAASEPDDTVANAHELLPGSAMEGRLFQPGGGPDRDRFRFSAPPDAIFAIYVVYPAGGDLSAVLEDQKGEVLLKLSEKSKAPDGATETLQSGRLVLPAGTYVLRLDGRLSASSGYTVRLDRKESGSANEEAEPNGLISYATPLASGKTLRGMLLDDGDRDVIRLDVPGNNTNAWTVNVNSQGPVKLSYLTPDGETVQTVRRSDAGMLSLDRLLLAPGHQYFLLEGKGEWQASASAVEPPRDGDEVENNDDAESATPLTPGKPTRFWMESPSAVDQFLLPLPVASMVELSLSLPIGVEADARLFALGGPKKGLPITFGSSSKGAMRQAYWKGLLPAGRHRLVLIAAKGAPDPGEILVTLRPPNEMPNADAGGNSEKAERVIKVAADQSFSQKVNLSIEGVSASDCSSVWIPAPGFFCDATAQGLTLVVPSYLPDGFSAPLVVSQAGKTSDYKARMTAEKLALPLEPVTSNGLPSVLAGGLDYALSGFGALPGNPKSAGLFSIGNDGRPNRIPHDGVEVTLAGKLPVTLQGIILTPPAAGDAGERLRGFRLEAKIADGTFSQVLTGQLQATAVPQAFIFPESVQAAALRLIPVDRWDGDSGDATLSRWAAIGKPGQLENPIDLARPDLGGHLVYAPPADKTLLGTQREWPGKASRLLPEGIDWTWVMAFRENRVANISAVSVIWPQADELRQIQKLEIEASDTGPLGPWRSIGALTPQSTTLPLENGTTVAALRFTPNQPAKGAGLAFPASISVIERPGESILSIPQERPVKPPPSSVATLQSAPEGKPFTIALSPRQIATIQLQSDDANNGSPRTLELGGKFQGLDLTLTDVKGNVIPLLPSSPEGIQLIADISTSVAPYSLKVQRRAAALAIVWDTSSSVDAYKQAISTSVRNLVGHLGSPGASIGAVNLVPFGENEPLLKQFTEDPATARGVLHAFHAEMQSSDSEKAMLTTLRSFRETTLEPAIIVLTDGDFPSHTSSSAWAEIEKVRPRIFTLRIPASESMEAEMLLGDWSSATGGTQSLVVDGWDTVQAFREIEGRLNTPVPVEFTWNIRQGPVEPGQFSVIVDPPKEKAGAKPRSHRPVLVVLDASGSMLGRIGGKRKIVMAKNLLGDLLAGINTQETSIGLRVFGSGRRDSCETNLVLPVAPTDVDQARSIIENILPKDGAKTAIGASLSQVANDLKQHSDGVIILITDGEETCGGDPEREIQALRQAGLNVVVNIIGFDVAEPELRARFEAWAELGRGTYFDARDQAGLETAMDHALAPRFTLVGVDGQIVASGIIGAGNISVPAGRFRLQLEGGLAKQDIAVSIAAGQTTILHLDQTFSPKTP